MSPYCFKIVAKLRSRCVGSPRSGTEKNEGLSPALISHFRFVCLTQRLSKHTELLKHHCLFGGYFYFKCSRQLCGFPRCWTDLTCSAAKPYTILATGWRERGYWWVWKRSPEGGEYWRNRLVSLGAGNSLGEEENFRKQQYCMFWKQKRRIQIEISLGQSWVRVSLVQLTERRRKILECLMHSSILTLRPLWWKWTQKQYTAAVLEWHESRALELISFALVVSLLKSGTTGAGGKSWRQLQPECFA